MPAAKKVLRALLVVATILLLAAILIPAYLRSKIADGGVHAGITSVIVSANEMTPPMATVLREHCHNSLGFPQRKETAIMPP